MTEFGRRLLVSLLALVLLALASAQDDVTITYWQYDFGTKVEAIDTLIERFEAENPGITVVHETFPYEAFNQRVAASVPAGVGPDVVNLFYGWLPLYIDSGYLQPLPEEYFPVSEIESEFTPMVQASYLDGQYWALPTAVRTLALFYNVDLLEEAGFDGPPRTWDEFIAVGQATARGSGNRYTRAGFVLSPAGQDHHIIREVLLRQFGGLPYSDDNRTVTYDSDAGAQALEYYTNFQLEHNMGMMDFFPGANGYRDAFKQGLAAMIFDGSFAIGQMQNEAQVNWAVAELPVDAETETQSNFGSYWAHGITRNATGDKLEAAAKFLQFITSEDAMRYWLEQVGEIPARTALANDPEFLNNPVYGPFIASLPYAHATFFVDEAGQRQVMLDAINRVILEGADPAFSLSQAAAQEQVILDEFWQNR